MQRVNIKDLQQGKFYVEQERGGIGRTARFYALENAHRVDASPRVGWECQVKQVDGDCEPGHLLTLFQADQYGQFALSLFRLEADLTDTEAQQFMERVKYAYKANPRWRLGQTFFNVLHEMFPRMAEHVRGTEWDPYHQETKIQVFLGLFCTPEQIGKYFPTHWTR